jgi:hypothetical protein
MNNDINLTGLFMALQPRIIACGNRVAAFSMAIRFLTGPIVMAIASIVVGLKGTLLHVAIVQVLLRTGWLSSGGARTLVQGVQNFN